MSVPLISLCIDTTRLSDRKPRNFFLLLATRRFLNVFLDHFDVHVDWVHIVIILVF